MEEETTEVEVTSMEEVISTEVAVVTTEAVAEVTLEVVTEEAEKSAPTTMLKSVILAKKTLTTSKIDQTSRVK